MEYKNYPHLSDCLLIVPALALILGVLLIGFHLNALLCIAIAFSLSLCFMLYKYHQGKFNPHFIKPSAKNVYIRILCLIFTYTPIYLCLYKLFFGESYGFIFYLYGGFIPYIWDIIYSIKRYKILFKNKSYSQQDITLLKVYGLYAAFLYGYILIDEIYLYASFLVLIILVPMTIKYITENIKGFLSKKIN